MKITGRSGVGLGRTKGAKVADNLEGEMSRRGSMRPRMRMRRRRCGGYVLGIGAGNKLVCCTLRRRGQVEFSSDRAPESPPRAGGPAEHQRQKVMLWRLPSQVIV